MTRSLARALVPCAALTVAACGGAPPGSKERPVSVVRPVAPAGTAPVVAASTASLRGLPRRRDGPHPTGARRPRDLVQGHRRQRTLPHVRVPAADGRPHRLVPRAPVAAARRPLRRLGTHQRPGLLHARQLPAAPPPASSRRTGSTGARATRRCSRSSARRAIAIPPATSRTRTVTRRTGRTPATSRSGPRRAPWGCASSRTRASTPSAGRRSTARGPAPGTATTSCS